MDRTGYISSNDHTQPIWGVGAALSWCQPAIRVKSHSGVRWIDGVVGRYRPHTAGLTGGAGICSGLCVVKCTPAINRGIGLGEQKFTIKYHRVGWTVGSALVGWIMARWGQRKHEPLGKKNWTEMSLCNNWKIASDWFSAVGTFRVWLLQAGLKIQFRRWQLSLTGESCCSVSFIVSVYLWAVVI